MPSPPLKIFSSSARSEKGVLGLCSDGGIERKQRQFNCCSVLCNLLAGKENSHTIDYINCGEKVKRITGSYIREHISGLDEELGPEARSLELH